MFHLVAALCCGMSSASAAWPSCSIGLAVPQVGIGLESRQGTPVATTRKGSLPRSARLISKILVQTVCVLQAAWCYLHEDAVAVFSRAREPYFFHRGGIVSAVADTAAALGVSGRLASGVGLASVCDLARGSCAAIKSAMGLSSLLASFTCCSHPRPLLLVAVSNTACARGASASRGICAMSAAVATRFFLT